MAHETEPILERVNIAGAPLVTSRIALGTWAMGSRHPSQLAPIDEVMGWRIDASAMAEIDRILAHPSGRNSWRRRIGSPLDAKFPIRT